MKKIIFLVFTLITLNACSENSANITSSSEHQIEGIKAENILSISSFKTDNIGISIAEDDLIISEVNNSDSMYMMTKGARMYFGQKKDLIYIKEMSESSEFKVLNWEGPFSISAQRIAINQYQQFLVDVPGYAAQVFNVEDIDYRGDVYLPDNTVGFAEIPNPVGWNAAFGDGPRILGITTSMSGKLYSISTYTFNVHSTIIGQQIGFEFPTTQLTSGFNYEYYYTETP